ncbi:MAG: folylpolyglutamate synthase/dihydrofolate synthase family protein [Bacteroides sp.]|jgi:dihydrofolate synthase/folylpolyglutamate synthase|nr:folylpolyglutamate synthase/dihydrofolate synthase family protein [Bacteroides sp.]
MNYKETLGYLFEQLPMFHRIGPAAYKANLDNTLALSRHLGEPEKKFRSIHIAGTNGKGSVANMLASVLQQQGYKTGLATSPHLKDFRERIRINGKMIPKTAVTEFIQKNKGFFEQLSPSFFEITIGLTFDYFAREQVDVAVVETGLGGRLDSTNIVTPEISIITNIGMDHMNLLGNTLEKIAAEKAGIIKKGIPLVVGKHQAGVQEVFEAFADEKGAPIFNASDCYAFVSAETKDHAGQLFQEISFKRPGGELHTYKTDLLGVYQQENLATALTALEFLNRQGKFRVSDLALRQGLSQVKENTGFRGRWYQLGKRPRIICDTGHNSDGIKMVTSQLSTLAYDKLRIVLGMVDDKDVKGVLSLFPKDATYYFCKPDVPRGLNPHSLAAAAASEGLKGEVYATVKEALLAAKREASGRDLIFVGGSTFVVAEVV